MLKDLELSSLLERLGIPERGRRLIEDARRFAPVRAVASRGGNVVTYLASRKMGREIGTESRHNEFAAAVRLEFDPAVLEYYPQPCELRLRLQDESGEVHDIRHIPDFLVIRETGVWLEEWKTEAKLSRLAEKYPWRYRKDTDGRWSVPLIEQELAQWGITYQVHSQDEIPRQWLENVLYLADYLHPAAEPCPEAVLRRIRAALADAQALYLADLVAEPHALSRDHLLKAIADGQLVADLEREPLADGRRSRIYRDAAVRELLAGFKAASVSTAPSYVLEVASGLAFTFDGVRYVVSLVGEQAIVLTDSNGHTTEVSHAWLENMHAAGRLVPDADAGRRAEQISRYSEAELRIALYRQQVLQGKGGVSERTRRRWRQRALAAQLNGGHEVLALVPRTSQKGNRNPRLSPEQSALVERVIRERWLTHQAMNYKACHRFLQEACNAAGVESPSYPTLIARIQALDLTEANRARHGKRRAYQEGDFVHVLHADSPVHGSRPFQYCHIDHTQLDIELICSRTGRNLGRPWLSLAVDSFSRRVLGFYLTFDPPSYRSTMMVVRDIVRRFARLPQFIVVDNGKDFQSTHFETFLMMMDVHLRFRPAGQPRHGAVLERLFGRLHSEYVHNLAGNTKATKDVRMTTGKFLPKRLAEWTLEALYHGIAHWAFEYYDTAVHPALNLSPREAFARGMAASGHRPHRQVVCNEDFLIATCPAVDREGLRRVDRQRGVKVDGYYYWAPEFRDLKVAGLQVPVRLDPWDASSVYARVGNTWVRCVCSTLAQLGPLTEVERQALSEEYRKRFGESGETPQSRQRLREFLQTFTPEGALALTLARQAENKRLYSDLKAAAIRPALAVSRPSVPIASPQPPIAPDIDIPLSAVTPGDDLPDFENL